MKKLSLTKFFATLAILFLFSHSSIAQCGVDVFVANDNSGSIDAQEDRQARSFISFLGQSFSSLGNANNQSRIAVSSWANTNTWSQYSFPIVGANYTIQQSDLTAYAAAPRVLSGGTDPLQALQRSFNAVNITPVVGRNVPKIIVVMTDASCFQVQPSIKQLATQIKGTGVYIMLLAIGEAATCADLGNGNPTAVASPGMYFTAPSYASLVTNAQATIANMISSLCATATKWDLTINITAANCATGAVSYTVNNIGNANFTNQTINVSFYNDNPALPTTKLLASTTHLNQTIVAGGSLNLNYINAAFIGKAKLYAVVNINPTAITAAPPLPFDLSVGNRLAISTEGGSSNNVSNLYNVTGCVASGPVLEVSKTAASLSCDKKATYNVQVCNTSAIDATNVIVTDIPESSNIQFVSATATGGYTAPGGGVNASYVHPGGDNSSFGFDVDASDIGGSININSPSLYIGTGFLSNYAGLIFPPVTTSSGVPAGATITSATIKFVTSSASNSPIIILGEKSVAAEIYSVVSAVPQSRTTTTASVSQSVSASAGVTLTYDIKNIIQELVNQPSWAQSSSSISLVVKPTGTGTLSTSFCSADHATIANRPVLTVTYATAATGSTIAAGQCITITYVYDASTAAAGVYDNSVGVTTATTGATFLPNNTTFTANGTSGLKGYNGAVNSGDEITVPTTTSCSQTPQALTTTVAVNNANTCGGNSPGYVTATITITNPNTQPLPNGVSIFNANELLNLTGTASFSGEPYNFATTGGNGQLLQMASANQLDPGYPSTTSNTLSGKTGAQNLQLYVIPPGTHTFNIDINPGTSSFSISSTVNNLPVTYNASGATATATGNVTFYVTPTVSISSGCSSPIAASTTTINFTSTGTNIGTRNWASSSGGTFSAATSANTSYTINSTDRANGFIDISISVLSTSGCEAQAICRVLLTGSVYDYGDLPASYDINKNIAPTVAAALVNGPSLIYLGNIAPDVDANTQPTVKADGDGADEDGVTYIPTVIDGITTYSLQVRAFNNSGSTAKLIGWIDWNNNGRFESTEASAIINVSSSATSSIQTLTWAGLTGVICANTNYIRIRIGSSITIFDYLGISQNGEIEDYVIQQPDYGNLPLAIWPKASATVVATNQAWLGITAANTECNTLLNDGADGFSITNAITGDGTEATPWLITGNNDAYNFRVTVNGSGAPKPVYYAVWYDVNGDGDFTDVEDKFYTGSATHGSPVSVNFSSTPILIDGTLLGVPSGRIRVIATSANVPFTKANSATTGANGSYVNGEVEDYYILYLKTILPIKLNQFSASVSNCIVNFNWDSDSLKNISQYNIEYSRNGQSFNNVASIPVVFNKKTYSYNTAALNGKSFYRLKMENNDGSVSYSNIVDVNANANCNNSSISIFPNPANSFININIAGYRGIVKAKFYNKLGQQVLAKQLNSGINSINSSSIITGIYKIIIEDENGKTETRKILIVH